MTHIGAYRPGDRRLGSPKVPPQQRWPRVLSTGYGSDACQHWIRWIPPAGARCDEGELLVATRLEQMVGSVSLVDGPGAPEGSHDFDVHVEGDVWAVEVTSTTVR